MSVLVNVLAMLFQQTLNAGYNVLADTVLSGDDTIRPEMFAIVRDGGASVVLLCCSYLSVRLARAKNPDAGTQQGKVLLAFWPKRKDWGDFLLVGLCGIWAGQLLGAIAIKNIGPVVFSVMQPAQPVLTLIIAVFIGMESLTLCGPCAQVRNSWFKVIGMVTCVGGAVAIMLLQPRKDSTTANIPYGSLAVGLQALLGALYGIFQKPLLSTYPPLVVTAWGYTLGFLEVVMTCFPSLTDKDFFHIPHKAILPLTYSILLNSSLGYFLMAWVNSRSSPFFVTMFYPTNFVITALLEFFFRGQRIYPILYGGGAAITVGLYLVVFAQQQEAKDETAQSASAVEDDERMHFLTDNFALEADANASDYDQVSDNSLR